VTTLPTALKNPDDLIFREFEQAPKKRRSVTASTFRFDPHQKRDARGRWSPFGGLGLAVQALHVADGRVDLEAHDDGVHISLADRRGGRNVSGMLDPEEAMKLGDALERAADPEFDEGHRVTNSVHTYRGEGQAPATGYAHITWGGDEPIRLELRDTTEGVELTPQEATVMADDLYRISAARRINTASGPLDIFVPAQGEIGMRALGDDGAPRDLVLEANEWRELWRGADVLWEGFDEMGEFADPAEDLDQLTIDTPDGLVKMRRIGDADSSDAHIEVEGPGGFKMRFQTSLDDPIWDAKEPATEYALAKGWIDE